MWFHWEGSCRVMIVDVMMDSSRVVVEGDLEVAFWKSWSYEATGREANAKGATHSSLIQLSCELSGGFRLIVLVEISELR